MTEEIQGNRMGEIRGVVCLAGALFLFLSLFSYHPLDPSFTHFTAGDAPIHNLAGTVGSHTADTLARLFGFGVFWFPVVLVIAGLKSLLE
ncbi:MAG: DNA translocase FtsK 4TM domain-containing protein, partial [Syntrophales bacterium]